jgi:hypothetical protein
MASCLGLVGILSAVETALVGIPKQSVDTELEKGFASLAYWRKQPGRVRLAMSLYRCAAVVVFVVCGVLTASPFVSKRTYLLALLGVFVIAVAQSVGRALGKRLVVPVA